jgi:Tfp pilus assembly protein PilO
MKRTDRTILLLLPAVALAIGFYLLAISPKQKELGELDTQIDTLTSRVSAAETEVAAAEDARKSFGSNYSEIVSLGSAVPEDSDQATLIYELTKISADAGVQFRSFELADSGDVAAEPAPAATTTTSTEDAPATADGTESTTTTTSESTTVSATPTEADAATLPIGATVGSAGLPVMPYKLRFNGSFFDMADFFASLDKSVDVVDTEVNPEVNGRLMTVNGFAMVGDPIHGFPLVQASVALNTYIVPADQGLSAGATPAGPTVAADETTTVTSASTSTSSVPEAAAVSP